MRSAAPRLTPCQLAKAQNGGHYGAPGGWKKPSLADTSGGSYRCQGSRCLESGASGSAAGKRVCDQRPFIRPPAVNRGFAYGRSFRNVFDGKVGEATLSKDAFRVLRKIAVRAHARCAAAREGAFRCGFL